ncbi:MAG: acyl carrier protein [Acidimicrobiales bacterium]|jgi:acyl carrier protein|nr:acyl carrier protein [Acidimicrobiales bacterium]
MTTADKLRRYITAEVVWTGPVSDLTDDYPLLDNEVFDSMALMQMLAFIEEEFDVEIDDVELTPRHWRTIADIAALVESKLPS